MSGDPPTDISARIRETAPAPSNEDRERARQALTTEILREETAPRRPIRSRQVRRWVTGLAAGFTVVAALVIGLQPSARGPAEELANRIADLPALTATATTSIHARQDTEQAVVIDGAGTTAGTLAYRLKRSIETVIADGTMTVNRSVTASFEDEADEAAYSASTLPQRDSIGTTSTTNDLALGYGTRWPTEPAEWADLTDPVLAIETLIEVSSDPQSSGAHRAAILRHVSQIDVTVMERDDSGIDLELRRAAGTWRVTLDRDGWVTHVIVTDGDTTVRQSTYITPSLQPNT